MISPFEHPFLSGLLGDAEMADRLGIEAELAAMLRFETALADTQASMGIIPAEAGAAIVATLESFRPDMAELNQGTARDGVVVPDLVRQIRHAVGEPHGRHVHLGATSQDVIDTALVLRAASCLDLLGERLDVLLRVLQDLDRRFGHRRLTGMTRMQPAIKISVSDRLASWRGPLLRSHERLASLNEEMRVIQFGGAAGTLDRLGPQGPAVRAALAARLGLRDVAQWHTQRDRIADLGHWLATLSGALGKIGQDVALMALVGAEIGLDGGGASSAMPHKSNPVDAEALVALARFNAAQVSALHNAMVHEQERSGTAWTLEWLVLPPMLAGTAASTRLAAQLLKKIREFGSGPNLGG